MTKNTRKAFSKKKRLSGCKAPENISCCFCLQQGLDVGGQLLVLAGSEEQLTELLTCNGSLEQVLVDALEALDQDLLKGAIAGEKFSALFFASCKDEELAAYIKRRLA